jgi:hypothetical protein
MQNSFWQGKPWQAFKSFAILFSFVMNLILLLVLLVAAPIVLPALNTIAEPLVGGLNDSFVAMGEANIVRTIDVVDEIPIEFILPLEQQTNVIVTSPVPLQAQTTFVLPGGGGQINGTVFLELPAGLNLPIALNLNVPVSQTVPVALAVDVVIPLSDTELGKPFGDLQALFAPLDNLVSSLPASNQELFERILGYPVPEDTTVQNEIGD